jgi:hypothetical protein
MAAVMLRHFLRVDHAYIARFQFTSVTGERNPDESIPVGIVIYCYSSNFVW